MRWHLLNTFNDIYILDLHGNAKKKESTPEGEPDKNVFDIQQGVSIVVAIKTGSKSKKTLAKLHHVDLWGDRKKKYELLESNSLESINFKHVEPKEPSYVFYPRNDDLLEEYNAFPSLPELMKTSTPGFKTHRDQFAVSFDKRDVEERIKLFLDEGVADEDLRTKYSLKDNRDWKLTEARRQLQLSDTHWEKAILLCTYRPFDQKYCYFSHSTMDFPRTGLLEHVAWKDNLCLGVSKAGMAVPERPWELVFASKFPMDTNLYRRGGVYIFPLYLYHADLGDIETKTPNLDPKIYAKIQKIVHDVTPEGLFDYIYATLHSPEYRNRYAEFLKSDFPRIPYPNDNKTFHALAKHGTELRILHLMESEKLNGLITTYPVDGDHEVKKPRYEDGKVWINETQYFGNVPEVAWNFYIGGYQPAQKWLKDRKGRKLSNEE